MIVPIGRANLGVLRRCRKRTHDSRELPKPSKNYTVSGVMLRRLRIFVNSVKICKNAPGRLKLRPGKDARRFESDAGSSARYAFKTLPHEGVVLGFRIGAAALARRRASFH